MQQANGKRVEVRFPMPQLFISHVSAMLMARLGGMKTRYIRRSMDKDLYDLPEEVGESSDSQSITKNVHGGSR